MFTVACCVTFLVKFWEYKKIVSRVMLLLPSSSFVYIGRQLHEKYKLYEASSIVWYDKKQVTSIP